VEREARRGRRAEVAAGCGAGRFRCHCGDGRFPRADRARERCACDALFAIGGRGQLLVGSEAIDRMRELVQRGDVLGADQRQHEAEGDEEVRGEAAE
jgi:hypothetical protein